MITDNKAKTQALSLSRQQFLAIYIVDCLLDIEENLEVGDVFTALHAIRDLASYIEATHAEEIALLENMPSTPVHAIDTALNAKRRAVLEKQAAVDDMQFRWLDNGDFELLTIDGHVVVTVHPNDNWISHTRGDGSVVGIGLTSLLAHLSPDTLTETAHRLGKWAARQQGGA